MGSQSKGEVLVKQGNGLDKMTGWEYPILTNISVSFFTLVKSLLSQITEILEESKQTNCRASKLITSAILILKMTVMFIIIRCRYPITRRAKRAKMLVLSNISRSSTEQRIDCLNP